MYDDYMENMFERKPINKPRKVGDIFLYVVMPGDNLYAISRVFNTSVDMIQGINDINPDMMIYPGQELLIPVLFSKKNPENQKPVIQPRQSYDLYF